MLLAVGCSRYLLGLACFLASYSNVKGFYSYLMPLGKPIANLLLSFDCKKANYPIN